MIKRFDNFVNEDKKTWYPSSTACDASFVISEYINSKINIKTSNMRIEDIIEYVMDNNIKFYENGEYLYFGIKIWLNSVIDNNFKEYIKILNNIDIELDKWDPLESNINGYEIYVYFKMTDKIKEYVINVINSEKGINKFKL